MTPAALQTRLGGADRPPARLHSLQSDGESVSAVMRIGERDHRLAYRVVGAHVEPRYEPFLAAALPIAMRTARSLSVPEPVSPRLLDALDEIQAIFAAWRPALRPVQVDAEADEPRAQPGRGTASFFSGGVDSFYTVLRHSDSLDALVFVPRFEEGLIRDPEKHTHVVRALRSAAAELGLPLIEVETNLRDISDAHLGWWWYVGAALASVATLLAPGFRRVLLPASNTYRDVFPVGTSPLLDARWSTEEVEIVHEGVTTRPEKVAAISSSDTAMRWLRVCYSQHTYNCGRCEKCVRTMINLELAGALGRCDTLPARLPSPREISRLPVSAPTTLIFARQNLSEAEARDADPALQHALRRLVWRGDWLLSIKPALTRRWERPVRLISPLARGIRRMSELARRVDASS